MLALFVVSLGCPKNTVDAEIMFGYLKKSCGVRLVRDPVEADVILINTCGFITPAKEESVDEILQALEIKREYPGKKVIVAGCLYERYRDELARELPEVDGFVGVYELERVVEALGCKSSKMDKPYLLRERITPQHIAYLKISDGCSNGCTFCSIPLIKGGFKHRKSHRILEEAEMLAERGAKELYIIAQDTTAYRDGKCDLVCLLEKLNDIKRLRWIRLMYTYPSRITDKLTEAVAGLKKVVNYMDVPLQHVDNRVLESMGRRYSESEARRLVEKLKKANISIRSTFIVGFPKETKNAFEKLCSFLEDYEIEWAGFFPYYKEEGTKAFAMRDKSISIKLQRLNRVREIQNEITERRLRRLTGKTSIAMVDGASEELEGYMEARMPSSAYEIDGKLFVKTDKEKPKAGRIIKVRLEGVLNHTDIYGTYIKT